MHSGLNGIWQLVPARDDVIAMEGHNSSCRGATLRAVICYVRCYATCGAMLRAVLYYVRTCGAMCDDMCDRMCPTEKKVIRTADNIVNR